MTPDLNTEEGRAAYRRELRRVAWPIRWGGLGLIVLGALIALGVRNGALGLDNSAMTFAYGCLAVGWAMVLSAIFMRTQHHKRRLREGL
jgi:hypothetical protein